jgi:hypothetical protein
LTSDQAGLLTLHYFDLWVSSQTPKSHFEQRDLKMTGDCFAQEPRRFHHLN